MSGGSGQRRRTSRSEQGDAAIMGLGGRGLGGGIAETLERLARERVGAAASNVVGRYAGAVTYDATGEGSGDYDDIVFDDFPSGVWVATGWVQMTLTWSPDLLADAEGLWNAGATDQPDGSGDALGAVGGAWSTAEFGNDLSGYSTGTRGFPALLIRNGYLRVACQVSWPDAIADPAIAWGVTIRAQRVSD